ncbi:hypothetical protein HUJ05_012190 [Dendroctonus ponderosae]|nr:hypothetical protein HUJ05_012190 [Dendroctonus ponderosae]
MKLYRFSASAGVFVQDAPQCPEQHGVQAYAHPEACNIFFLCTNGTLTVETCENGLLFDGKGAVHNHCNYNWAVHCGERKADPVVGFKCPTKVPSGSPAARFWPYPRFAVPGDCHRLITCVNGHPRLITCGEGKVLDDKTLTCEEPENVPQCYNSLRK